MKEAPKSFKFGGRDFRKKFKKNDNNLSFINLNSYYYGIKAIENGWITNKQMSSILRLIKIFLKRKIKLKINASFISAYTKKPLETRMGSGKAERRFWRCPIKKGMILFEFGELSFDEINYIFFMISNRLTFLIKLIKTIY
jgi:large subunit ribosomal protein L16